MTAYGEPAGDGLDAASVEEDFWVCWTLRDVFSNPDMLGPMFFGATP